MPLNINAVGRESNPTSTVAFHLSVVLNYKLPPHVERRKGLQPSPKVSKTFMLCDYTIDVFMLVDPERLELSSFKLRV